MDFVVLARKLRPARFEHLIGQETVVRALRNAILTDRVAHAFLFAGSRGVGKTSTARILTKALNCEHPEQGEPCNACDNCREITLNTSPDVYEIDAASNRGIDNIRELRENTKYAPVKSRYKTYIIDEVHMLTMESFNALLKTLEEPPPHVKFILATTSPHRIPDTILSRCQRYDFARIPLSVLTDYLVDVTGREGIRLSRSALETIARNAAGGVRDALTAVDQVVSYAGLEASDAQVVSILGITDNREVFTLLGAVLGKSLPEALDAFAAIREHGHDLGVLLEAMIREVKDFSLYLALEGNATVFAEHPPDTLAFFAEWRSRVTLDELQQLFYLLLEVEEQIKRSDFAQVCFEMGLVKACRVQPLLGVRELLAQVRGLGSGAPTAPGGAAGAPGGATVPVAAAAPAAATSAPPAPRAQAASSAAPANEFARIAARGQARARESTGGAGQAPGAPARSGDRGSAEDEGEPAPAVTATLTASAAPTAPERDASRAAPAAELAPAPEAAPAAGPAAVTPEPAAAEQPPPADEGVALCDDPRWRALVEALGPRQRWLATKLRMAEVREIGTDAVRVLAADEANRPTPAELEAALPLVREAFGPAFHIALPDDTNEKAREAHTIAGRNRIEAAARLAARRAQAENDEQVQRLLRHFPKGRIVEVALSNSPGNNPGDNPGDEPHANRSDDV
jgi:DNA polymerase-3 subunit gamma/tau